VTSQAPQNLSLAQGPPAAVRKRIGALDVVRGFALCGILLVNLPPIASVGQDVMVGIAGASDDMLGLLTVHRFFPIFSFLFGIGFALQMRSAAARVPRPRLVLLRRLLVLLGIGVLHFLLWPGDILTTYALVGMLVLLPSTWLPRWAATGLAGVLIAASLALGGDRLLMVAGLFMLGSVLVRFGIVDRIEESTRVPLLLGLALDAAAAPLVWTQVEADLSGRLSGIVVNAAGILLAGVYVCALLVLLRTPLRPALATVFAPLGRMALTNYLAATVIVTSASLVSGDALQHLTSGEVIAIATAVLCVQWLWSVLWLRRFRYGPLEWLWRWATWARRPTLRR
jgi:uncharacterized protein